MSKDPAQSDANVTADVATPTVPQVHLDRPLEVDDQCHVIFRDGPEQLRAKIVERRPINYKEQLLKGKKRKKRDLPHHSYDIPENAKASDLEYYVHYINHDRRLDQWVRLEKFVLSTLKRHADNNNTESAKAPASASGDSDADSGRRSRRSSGQVGTMEDDGAGSQDGTDGNSAVDNILSGGNWHGTRGDSSLAALEREHEETTKVKNIEKIFMGCYEVECWYYSPYPEPYEQAELLYVCEFCLKYMKKAMTFRKHKATCPCRHPPGREIYREYGLSVFEVDGKDHRVYCQNLCLLAKLFLDHKTLYYDVDPFYFYIITEVDDSGAHIVGYFSKEKVSAEEYNLACILTFPQFQKHGYGKFIISLSYELTKREKKTGSPEKPLSDLGKISYRSYWTYVLFHLLAKHDPKEDLTIRDISIQTGIKTEDIISTLQYLDMIKCWKGQHVIFVKQDAIDKYMKQDKKFRLCKPECLDWTGPPSSGKK
ncbi:acyl-CoA N-acyltransferase [Nitzschia inconspicua]|uniref:Histone acetyltransferase n=1 Tax=Nitzschia inconspicua TaxID=303405 RepID=A0A9K3PBF0_9STRA|nr:acyl-CoA N-acyltransferase [Nitzschia inconspicua]